MTSLKEENEKLKAENKKLLEQIELQKAKTEKIYERHRYLLKKVQPTIITLYLDTIRYQENPGPHLKINNSTIFFESRNDKAAELAKTICTKERLMEFKNGPVAIDEIYKWFYPEKDWFDITKKSRKEFRNNLYQWFRRLNDKVSPCIGNQRLFKMTDKEYHFNRRMRTIPNSKDK